MATNVKNNISRFYGDTYPETATLTVDGAALDLTGYTVKMIISTEPETEITATITDATAGKVSFPMDTVATIPATRYTYKIITDDGEYITTFVKATLEIL